MPTISGITGVADASALSAVGSTAANSSLNQESFLNLLTTQMQHQDPLSPMANEDMVAQLATFSSLEQLMDIRDATQANTVSITNLTNTTMASLVGNHVVAIGDTFPYPGDGEPMDLQYNSSSAAQGTLNIYDEDNKLVSSSTVSIEAGDGTLSWDGLDLSGQPLEEGEYRFEIDATDSLGLEVDVSERISGIIDSMDYSSGSPLPTVNGVSVGLGDLIKLTAGGDEASESS